MVSTQKLNEAQIDIISKQSLPRPSSFPAMFISSRTAGLINEIGAITICLPGSPETRLSDL